MAKKRNPLDKLGPIGTIRLDLWEKLIPGPFDFGTWGSKRRK